MLSHNYSENIPFNIFLDIHPVNFGIERTFNAKVGAIGLVLHFCKIIFNRLCEPFFSLSKSTCIIGARRLFLSTRIVIPISPDWAWQSCPTDTPKLLGKPSTMFLRSPCFFPRTAWQSPYWEERRAISPVCGKRIVTSATAPTSHFLDSFTFEPWDIRCVEPFMMLINDRFCKIGYFAFVFDDFKTRAQDVLHGVEFPFRIFPRLVQNAFGHPHLSDIMQQAAQSGLKQDSFGISHCPRHDGHEKTTFIECERVYSSNLWSGSNLEARQDCGRCCKRWHGSTADLLFRIPAIILIELKASFTTSLASWWIPWHGLIR